MGSCTSAAFESESCKSAPTAASPPSPLAKSGYLENIPICFPAHNAHRDISKLLQFKTQIGRGETGSVFIGFYKEKQCAIKRIKQDAFSAINFSTEAQALSALQHPSIIGYVDMFLDSIYYYLVLDKADYDLHQLIIHKQSLSERRTKHIIHSVLCGVAYLHSKAIAHRDLKPENIVFKADDKYKAILIDFGDAEIVIEDKIYTEFVGTPCYMSPERLGKHDSEQLKKADIWAIGVIAYEIYSGCRCFEGETQKNTFGKILRCEWSWNTDREPSVLMQDFVSKCLNPNSKQRMSANDALKHRWFADMTKKTDDVDVCHATLDLMDCCDNIANIPPIDEYDMVRMESFDSLSANVL